MGWRTPPGAEVADRAFRTYASPGRADIQAPAPTADLVARLVSTLREGHAALASRPWRETAASVGRVADRMVSETDPLHRRAVGAIVDTTTLTLDMARAVLLGMAQDWRRDRLIATVESEPPLEQALDRFTRGPRDMRLRARGFPLTVHVGAGTVPGVCGTSLIRALLVKSAVLAKPGAGDVALTTVLVDALADEDSVLAAVTASVYWPGEETPEALYGNADLWVVYGGDDTVSEVRRRVPAHVPVVAYPHRLSVGMVAREALDAPSSRETAAAVAGAAVLFDQRGCVSPHLIFAEQGGRTDVRAWAEVLGAALANVAEELPAGSPSTAEASLVRQVRDEAEVRAALDGRVMVCGPENLAWTLIVDPDASPLPVGSRTLRVRPVPDLAHVADLLGPLAPRVQTVGYAGPAGRALPLAEALSAAGVTRFCSFAEQAFPPPWWKHDGQGPLSPLVRWSAVEPADDPV